MLNRFTKFSLLIAEIDRCWHKLAAEEMAKYGLNSPHAVYLNTLYDAGAAGITAAQLSEMCDKDKAAVSRALAELERRALVTREMANDTAYRALIRLTEEGSAADRYV